MTGEAARLSRMLFEAREHLSMWSDVVTSQTGKVDMCLMDTIAAIDTYREERGWNPHGFGGEEMGMTDQRGEQSDGSGRDEG